MRYEPNENQNRWRHLSERSAAKQHLPRCRLAVRRQQQKSTYAHKHTVKMYRNSNGKFFVSRFLFDAAAGSTGDGNVFVSNVCMAEDKHYIHVPHTQKHTTASSASATHTAKPQLSKNVSSARVSVLPLCERTPHRTAFKLFSRCLFLKSESI